MNKIILCFTIVFLFTCCPMSDNNIMETKPNIVFIISDDQGWTDYGFMGHSHIETPNIDKLAASGLTYTRGYVAAPLCSPSLASVISGLYPHQHLVTGNDPVFKTETKKYSDQWLRERKTHVDTLINLFKDHKLLTDMLAEEGYVSFQTGKWWLGGYEDGGFDYGMTHGMPEKWGRHGDFGLEIGRQGMDTLYKYLNLAQEQQKPFFLWYAPFLPHTPHNPPDSLLQKYLKRTDSGPIARYWANCEWFDITVGQIMDYLDEKKLTGNTVIFYVCDNGWIQHPTKRNRYMEGSKRSPYDMGIRTPIMVSWPDHIKNRMDTLTLSSSIDIVPTVIDILDIPQPKEMQGKSLLGQDQLMERNTVFSEAFYHDMKSMHEPSENLKYRVIINGEWKLILPDTQNLPDSAAELYHILTDPFEQVNRIDEYPEIADTLSSKLNDWWKS